jgi:hypothetical protein
MDYARFNYVAQPEDGVTSFYPAIGEYDLWSIKWGYSVIPAVDTEAERPILNEWVKERADDPVYFYGRQTIPRIDPRSQSEDLGDDAALASTYGIANLKRIVPQLRAWTDRTGEDYSELEELYGQVVAQWGRYMAHVARNIGGVYENHKTYDQEGVVYDIVPEEIQKESMSWLNENGFNVPAWLLNSEVLDRIQHAGALDRIRRTQTSTLDLILEPSRIARLIEADARFGAEAYGPQEMLQELRRGLWIELRTQESIHAVRRNLQNGYIDRMEYLMSDEASGSATPIHVTQSDIRALVRGELRSLDTTIERALRRMQDRMTVLHLNEVRARIKTILDDDE